MTRLFGVVNQWPNRRPMRFEIYSIPLSVGHILLTSVESRLMTACPDSTMVGIHH